MGFLWRSREVYITTTAYLLTIVIMSKAIFLGLPCVSHQGIKVRKGGACRGTGGGAWDGGIGKNNTAFLSSTCTQLLNLWETSIK